MNNPIVTFIVTQCITPSMYVLFFLLVIVVGLLMLSGAIYLCYWIVNRYYRIQTGWMTRRYLNDLLEYAKNNPELMDRRKTLLKMREKL